jgi:hypothetical protein
MATPDELAPHLGREVHVALNAGSVRLLLVGVLRQGDSGDYLVRGRPVGTLAQFRAADVARVIEQDNPIAVGEPIVAIELRTQRA